LLPERADPLRPRSRRHGYRYWQMKAEEDQGDGIRFERRVEYYAASR
jgi:hypothetical protein